MKKAIKAVFFLAVVIALVIAVASITSLAINFAGRELGIAFGIPHQAHNIATFICMLVLIAMCNMESYSLRKERDRLRKDLRLARNAYAAKCEEAITLREDTAHMRKVTAAARSAGC
jgi:hypothetical protein